GLAGIGGGLAARAGAGVGAVGVVPRRAAGLTQPRIGQVVVDVTVAVVVLVVAGLRRRAGRAVADQRARVARGGAGHAGALAVGPVGARAVGAARLVGVGQVVVGRVVAVVVEAVAGFRPRADHLGAGRAARTGSARRAALPLRGAHALGVGGAAGARG